MKAHYDPEVDALAISWGNTPIEESDEIEPGVILDYDADDNVIGIEVLNASKKIKQLDRISTQQVEDPTLDDLVEMPLEWEGELHWGSTQG